MSNSLKIILIALGVGAVGAGTWFFLGSAGKSEQLKYIPSDAVVVASINLRELHGKVDMDRVKKTGIWKQMEKQLERSDDLEVIASIVQEPESSGIDFKSEIYFFGNAGKYNMESGGLVFALSDEGKFEKLVRKSQNSGGIKKEDKYKYAKLENDGIIGWNSNTAIVYGADKSDRLEKDLDNLMLQDKKDGILSNEQFKELQKKTGDINLWFNYNELMAMQGFGRQISALTESFGMEDMMGLVSLTFEKNEIRLAMRTALKDKEKASDMNIFHRSGISEEHYKMISPDDVYAVLSGSLDIPKLMDVMSDNKEFKSSLTELEDELELSRKELQNLFTGDFSLAIVGFDNMLGGPGEGEQAMPADSGGTSMYIPQHKGQSIFRTVQYEEDVPVQEDEAVVEEGTDNFGYGSPGDMEMPVESYRSPAAFLPDFVFSVSAKDPGAIERILKKKGMEKNEDGIYTVMGAMPFFVVFSENGMSITNNNRVALRMLKKSSGPKKFEGKELLKNNPGACWIDLVWNHYPNALRNKLEESMGDRAFRKFKETISQFTELEMKSQSAEGTVSVKMTESDKSPLMRLLEMADDME